MTLEALAKQGQTTVYNSLVASIGPRIREIRKEYIKESFYGFQQVEHRLELVALLIMVLLKCCSFCPIF